MPVDSFIDRIAQHYKPQIEELKHNMKVRETKTKDDNAWERLNNAAKKAKKR